LRERKKERTRQAIQDEAVRLFLEQGYERTTIDQIAAAAEVSERTLFRYFPTKADILAYDMIEPAVAEAFVGQPPRLTATAALRAAIQQVYASLPQDRIQRERGRQRLIAEVRGLRAITPRKIDDVLGLLTAAALRRTGRAPGDQALSTWVGAVAGVIGTCYRDWALDPAGQDIIDLIDGRLAALESGLM
jgi:AcrR family transcriptional regulator